MAVVFSAGALGKRSGVDILGIRKKARNGEVTEALDRCTSCHKRPKIKRRRGGWHVYCSQYSCRDVTTRFHLSQGAAIRAWNQQDSLAEFDIRQKGSRQVV